MLSYLYRTGTAFYLSWLDRAHSAIGSHRVNVGGHGVVAGLPAGREVRAIVGQVTAGVSVERKRVIGELISVARRVMCVVDQRLQGIA